MTARTYTPEAIEKLVDAAQLALMALLPTTCPALSKALRPFTTEPSSWESYCRELWGDGWVETWAPQWAGDRRYVTPDEVKQARAAYRARYGVEPV